MASPLSWLTEHDTAWSLNDNNPTCRQDCHKAAPLSIVIQANGDAHEDKGHEVEEGGHDKTQADRLATAASVSTYCLLPRK